MSRIRRSLSFANVVSVMALFIALSGAAYAGTKVTSKNLASNAVTTAKIKNSAVTAAKLATNAVTTKAIADGAVTTSKLAAGAVTTDRIANDAVTGDKVNEATLGTVPNATSATNATNATNAGNATTVNGQKIVKVFAKVPVNTTQTIATFDTFKLTATCDAGGNVEPLVLDPSSTDVDLAAMGNGNGGAFFDRNQGVEPNSINLDQQGATNNDRGISTFSVARSGSFVATGSLTYNDTNTFNAEANCAVYGEVIQAG